MKHQKKKMKARKKLSKEDIVIINKSFNYWKRQKVKRSVCIYNINKLLREFGHIFELKRSRIKIKKQERKYFGDNFKSMIGDLRDYDNFIEIENAYYRMVKFLKIKGLWHERRGSIL